MRSRNSKSVGALHPIFFFAVMYVVVLVLSIFICSSIFESLNGTGVSGLESEKMVKAAEKETFPLNVSAAALVR
ncbi:MAG TPA: hypothetical protein PKC69_03150 [Chitinophagaceae bacterium]|nr:hypothetical protein [Chitinophagaceae bacterium]